MKQETAPISVADIVNQRGNDRENLLQILHDIQTMNSDNSLHKDDLDQLSDIMGIPESDLVSTLSFYSMFSLKPRGRHIIRLCESPPCHVMGSETVLDALRDILGVAVGETTEDGRFTLETTSCLGTCAVAPVMMIDDTVYGNLTREKVAGILASVAADQDGGHDS
ncbi:MAG: NAD(P)H-dependent oxidoreductase subunit E [Lentisphaeria bacterium]|nr:NAD(P)H-dependent oxidoreductase subunit E [Lentisphaeria bacterium]